MDVVSDGGKALLPVNEPDRGFYGAGELILSVKEVDIEEREIVAAEEGVD